jgi:hypothetical protein
METPGPGSIMVDNNALKFLHIVGAGSGGYMETYGGANMAQGYNKQEQAFIKTLQDHPDKLSMIWSTDPVDGKSRAVMAYRDFRAEFNNFWRQPGVKDFTDEEIKKSTLLVLREKSPYFANQMDPDTVQFRTEVQDDGSTTWKLTAKNKDLSKPPFEMDVRPDDPRHDTLRTQLGKNIGDDLKAPSLSNFISTTYGLSLAREMIANNKRDAMLSAATGRGAPGENWTATVDAIRSVVETFTDKQVKDGNTQIQRIQPEDWEKIRNSESTINRYGSLYSLFFGAQNMAPLLGQGGTQEATPREVGVPGPQSTGVADTLEGQRKAAESRATADPLTLKLIEKSYKPPGKP